MVISLDDYRGYKGGVKTLQKCSYCLRNHVEGSMTQKKHRELLLKGEPCKPPCKPRPHPKSLEHMEALKALKADVLMSSEKAFAKAFEDWFVRSNNHEKT